MVLQCLLIQVILIKHLQVPSAATHATKTEHIPVLDCSLLGSSMSTTHTHTRKLTPVSERALLRTDLSSMTKREALLLVGWLGKISTMVPIDLRPERQDRARQTTPGRLFPG